MSDIIDEKEEIFGIFSQHPQKLMILPGLKPILSKFIGKFETLKAPSRITCHTPMVKNTSTNKKREISEACEDSLSRDTIETLIQKLCAWLKSHKNFEKNFAFLNEKMQEPGLIIENTFSLVISSNTSNSPGGITFTSKVCKKSVKLQFKVTGSLILSNTHNHISARCWLNDNPDMKMHLKEWCMYIKIMQYRVFFSC